MVFDVEQLSVIRGASLTCLYSPDRVEAVLAQATVKTKRIFAGGSHGAWVIEATEDEALALLTQVRAALSKDDLEGTEATGAHSQIVYNSCMVPIDGDEMAAFRAAEAINKAAQLQNMSLPLPTFDDRARIFGQDERHGADRVRPAATPLPYTDDAGNKITASVSENYVKRFQFGRQQRDAFYERFTGKSLGDFQVASSMEDIVAGPRPDGMPRSLGNKVALFFADGNRLGAHVNQCADLAAINRFSENLVALQKKLLEDIIAYFVTGAEGEASAAFRSGKGYRLETLLFGGDELIFVVPSWLALDFARFFFDRVADWTSEAGPITFSGAMVICNHKTPIRQAKVVAEEMTARMKMMQPDGGGRRLDTRNLFQIEVFESLSLPETDFDTYRERLFLNEAGAQDDGARNALEGHLTIAGSDIDALFSSIAKLKQSLPRSQLYKLLQAGAASGAAASRKGADQAVQAMFDTWLSRAGDGSGLEHGSYEILKNLTASRSLSNARRIPVPPRTVSLNMLAALWDYVDPLAIGEVGGETHG